MNNAYLLLGSNDGVRETLLARSLELLAQECGHIDLYSSVYETPAWGLTDQPDFLNMAILLKTPLTAHALLEAILGIEQKLGRQRNQKWGQRTIDIDILFFNHSVVDTPHLKVPHPLLHLRRFTLVPLAEIAPAFVHPVLEKAVSDLLADCPDMLPVHRSGIEIHFGNKS